MEPELKSQLIRLFDVTLLGPLMIRAGVKGKMGNIERTFFIVSGVLTIYYNYKNYTLYKLWLKSQETKNG
jgi:hypothetical protein